MIKVIYILPHTPVYEIHKDNDKPYVFFENETGMWIGVFEKEWGNKLGNYILQYNDNIEFEFWRPDFRADKIYTHEFSNGLKHKVFPAQTIKNFSGIKNNKGITSREIIEELIKFDINYYERNVILHLDVHGNLPFSICENTSNLPIIGTFHGEIRLPQDKLFKLRKNIFSYLSLIKDYLYYKKIYKRYSLITYQSNRNLNSLTQIYKGPIEKVTMGVDFDYFTPKLKAQCRSHLNLPLHKKIIITVSRLNSNKQVHKVIDVLSKLDSNFDFLYIVVGKGNTNYENTLFEKANKLIKKNKIIFPGFIDGQKLIDYLNAADLFIMSSKHEAGPVSSMEALACEIPVFTTNTGRVAEVLSENNKGIIVEPNNYNDWEHNLRFFLNDSEIQILDRKVAYNFFSWTSIAEKFGYLYEKLIDYKAW